MADGKVLDNEIGHTAPLYVDIEDRGVCDLLVGQFDGRTRIYRNYGTTAQPTFKDFKTLMAGGTLADVPTG